MQLVQLSDEPEAGGTGTSFGRLAESVHHPYVVGVVTWALVLAGACVAARVLVNPGIHWENPVGHVLLESCALLASIGIVYCLWVQYCVSGERWILLATIAFSSLIVGEICRTLSLAAYGSPPLLGKLALDYYSAWRIAAICILMMAACTRVIHSRQESRRRGLRLLLESLIGLACVLTVGLYAVKSWPQIANAFYGFPKTVLEFMGEWTHNSLLVPTLTLVVLAYACTLFLGRHLREEDEFSDGIAKYLVLACVGQLALLLSAGEYDLCWWLSIGFRVAALMVLLARLGLQFGASYADARIRVAHLEAVHYMSSRLSNTLDLRVVLLALVSDTADMLSARYSSVMLADDSGEALTTVVTHGLPEDPVNPRQPKPIEGSGRPDFFAGHTARAFREKRVCVVDDVYTDVEFVPWRLLARSDGYAVSVPLVYQEIALGVINLFFDQHTPLNDERIRLFQTLASAASVAIVNAQLYERTAEDQCDTSWLLGMRLAS